MRLVNPAELLESLFVTSRDVERRDRGEFDHHGGTSHEVGRQKCLVAATVLERAEYQVAAVEHALAGDPVVGIRAAASVMLPSIGRDLGKMWLS